MKVTVCNFKLLYVERLSKYLMKWIEELQNAIKYIEKNINNSDALSFKLIANQAYCSESHFKKIFSILTGVSISDYIRNRRLSFAGEELILSNIKIIDLALKYGYETPESFTKAFTRFHGHTPSFVRQNRVGLKTFNPICIEISIEGGSLLDYEIIDHPPIRMLGKSKMFNSICIEENNINIPSFCRDCYNDDGFRKIFTLANDDVFKGYIMGFRDELENNNELRFTLGISYNGNYVHEGLNIIDIPAMNWVKFKCVGKRPKALQDLWYRIYTEFMPFSSFEIIDNITLEVSPFDFKGEESYLWMPIRQNGI